MTIGTVPTMCCAHGVEGREGADHEKVDGAQSRAVCVDACYDACVDARRNPLSPEQVAAMSDAEYERYVRELVDEAERGAKDQVCTTEEVLARLAEARRGRARRVGT
jgi:hypothetical protein